MTDFRRKKALLSISFPPAILEGTNHLYLIEAATLTCCCSMVSAEELDGVLWAGLLVNAKCQKQQGCTIIISINLVNVSTPSPKKVLVSSLNQLEV